MFSLNFACPIDSWTVKFQNIFYYYLWRCCLTSDITKLCFYWLVVCCFRSNEW